MASLPGYEIALRLAMDGLSSKPFSARTLPPLRDDEMVGAAKTIRRVSAERYGRPLAQVEREIEDSLA